MTGTPTLTTERLVLRGPEMRDFARYAAFYASPRARHVGGPLSGAQAWKSFASDAGHWALKGFGWWVVEEGGEQVGHVGLHHPPHQAELELGWTLYEGAEGRGLAREAAEAARDWARATLPPQPLVSYIATGNAASIRLAERLGAVRQAERAAHDADAYVYVHPEAHE